jgi:BTB/POZ domain-containing protein 9
MSVFMRGMERERDYIMFCEVVDENVATIRHGAQVIRGEMKTALLDGDSTTYDLDRGFTRHPIDESVAPGIVVRLGQPCIINSIRMLLWDRDMRYVFVFLFSV